MPQPAKPLTDRQERFVHEYLIDHNASAAAERAGYSPKSRASAAAELMANPRVCARIVFEQGELFARIKVHAAELMLAHVRAAYFDPARLFDAARKPVPLDELDADTRGGINVAYDSRANGDCVLRVRQVPRQVALAALGKRFDNFQKLQMQVVAEVAAEREAQKPAPAAPALSAIGEPQPDIGARLFGIVLEPALAQTPEREKAPEPVPPEAMPPDTPAAAAPVPVMPTPSSVAEAPAVVEAASVSTVPAAAPNALPPLDPPPIKRRDPNLLWGGVPKHDDRQARRDADLAEQAAAQAATMAAKTRIKPHPAAGNPYPPGFNPPWMRDSRPQVADGAGEFEWS